MSAVTFNGENESGYVKYFGITFPCGKTVEVTDEAALAKLGTHPEFTVSASKAQPKAAPEALKTPRAVKRRASPKGK